MSQEVGEKFPRGALIAAAALIGFALITTGVARLTGFSTGQTPVAEQVASRDLVFRDNPAGGVWVLTAPQNGAEAQPLTLVVPGEGGFIRGVMRSMARERRMYDVGEEPAFRLTRWADTRLSLTDLATGRQVELTAFGPTNTDAFGKLLDMAIAADGDTALPDSMKLTGVTR
ncbi:MAG: photosynthetic complex assembly protein PuhC [Alphaproteobacteria bacterium]|nr:photosynthetic complex assembly protein PuhC [Alphaproteobacteria bacterium]